MVEDTSKPKDPMPPARGAPMRGAKRWIKRVRIGLMAVSVILCVYAIVSYSVYTLPGLYKPDSNKIQSPIGDVMPGDSVVLLKLNLWREPKLGDVVIYEHPDPKDGAPPQLIGRIAGLPGESVKRNGPTMQVEGREPLPVGFPIGPDVAIKDEAVIPEGEYLIVTDTDAIAYADSRDFGFVKRDAIQKKVVVNLAPMLGQR
jgi:signal peptidase I